MKKSIALIAGFMVIVVLVGLSAATISRSVTENYLARQHRDAFESFWLAEAGVNRALSELRDNYSASGNNLWQTALGNGGYTVDVAVEGQSRRITAYGFVPSTSPYRAQRQIEVVMTKSIPPGFYDNAIYSAGGLDINGDAYNVSGDVLYAGDFDVDHPENIVDGTITQDTSINPLARLDFEQLYLISQAQGNVYDADRLKEVQKNNDSLPTSFWFTDPTDPSDPSTGVPNVVYVTTDLQLNGSFGTVGGFFVVVGDVITDPEDTEDATLNGNGIVEGAIYTRGEFRINGGGGVLNVNGGVWAGEEARLNGSADVVYNEEYMSAIGSLGIDASVQITEWKDLQNPYQVAP